MLIHHHDFEEGTKVRRVSDGLRGTIAESRANYEPLGCGCCSDLRGYTVDIDTEFDTLVSLYWDNMGHADVDNEEWETV